MKISRTLGVVGFFALCLPMVSWAQTSLSANADAAVRISEARKANAALMKQYTWHNRMDVTVNGEIKDIRLDLVNYGPDGHLQYTVVNDQSAPLPRGFLRRAVAKQKKEQMETYLTGLKALLEEYTLPTAGKILDFMNSATTSGPDAAGQFEMTGLNAVVPGDTLTVWADAKTRHTKKIQVNTNYQGDSVAVEATFQTLPSGLNYMAYGEVTIPAKEMNIRLQNFDYTRPN